MNQIQQLAQLGTSTWLDDLSRDRIVSGNLAQVIKEKAIAGVTTNPAIFAAAMTKGTAYDEQIAELKQQGVSADEAVYAMAIADVQAACDLFLPIFEQTGGEDGRVSIEVDPRISADTDATVAQAKELWAKVDRPNAMIKIPATAGSLPAIVEVLGAGISVNVTLIFSVARYREVLDCFAAGIRLAAQNGHDVSKIHSVASIFVSRMDTEVDRRLDAVGTPEAETLKGKAGIANAQLAYAEFCNFFRGYLPDVPGKKNVSLPEGFNIQRPLWASTGVKNPEYPATMYVSELAGPKTVNTMPEGTIDAVLAADSLHGDTLSEAAGRATQTILDLTHTGIDFAAVIAQLETEGVQKFVDSWNDLLASMAGRLR